LTVETPNQGKTTTHSLAAGRSITNAQDRSEAGGATKVFTSHNDPSNSREPRKRRGGNGAEPAIAPQRASTGSVT